MVMASYRHLSHLNFDSINLISKYDIVTGLPKLNFVNNDLCSSCELGKSKRKSFHNYDYPELNRTATNFSTWTLCGPMRVESINGKKYVLVIVDDYSRYTWTHFLRSKDETPVVLIDFLIIVQRGLHAQVRTVQTDKGMEFLNKTLHTYFAKEGYSTQSRAYQVFYKRTRIIVETIHVNFDELPQMASDHAISDPVPQCPTMLGGFFVEIITSVLVGEEVKAKSQPFDILLSLFGDNLNQRNALGMDRDANMDFIQLGGKM
ncbi:retrovirus-related pol polyprotein from transposon TNT 1-94 [Tanacetum coccineum]